MMVNSGESQIPASASEPAKAQTGSASARTNERDQGHQQSGCWSLPPSGAMQQPCECKHSRGDGALYVWLRLSYPLPRTVL